jgi:subfamily B ATP-binding cassette protein MsbA
LLVYFGRLFAPSLSLGFLWFSVQDSAAGLERVFFLMDLPSESDDDTGAVAKRRFEGLEHGVGLEGVSYVYPDGTSALHDVDAFLPVGRMIALVGPAGAGKTTLASLLPRFIDPTAGRMTLDGVDAREFSLASLRAHTSFVFQETMLFDGSVADNIRLARPDASQPEIEQAAQLAGAEEFIVRLPQGYDTPLGQRGGKLSVGQKQRLSIARALVRESPIIVLDEPTSALDPRTEAQLVATLHRAREGRLVVVIAHRLSTIRAADEICFVDEGRIVERGSHAALMGLPGGRYRRFTELQARGAA